MLKIFLILLITCGLFVPMFSNAVKASAGNGEIGVRIADYILEKWPNPDRITTKRWEYTNGIIFYGIQMLNKEIKEHRYYNYIKGWVDQYLDEKGVVSPIRSGHNLDVIQPSTLFYDLYEVSREPKYELGAAKTRQRYENFPVNSQGGFWHKANYPHQMWADGQYMAIPFIARYGATFAGPGPDQEYCFHTAVYQLKLLAKHGLDLEKKLLYHGWNDRLTAIWADPETGLSPEFWCRGLGWYCMALVDTLEYLPSDYPGYQDLIIILRTLAEGLRIYQDPLTGLWFQVIDKGGYPGNWVETSGSAMFVYTLKKAVEKGYINSQYEAVSLKGWDGVKSMVDFTSTGKMTIRGTVQGMGIQDSYENYIHQETVENYPHGMAAVMMAASVMEY